MMKKLLALALILALLLPAAALALTGDSPFFGKWVAEEHHAIKHFDTVMHFVWIHRNTPCVYMKFNMNHGGSLGRPSVDIETMYDSQWEVVDEHIRIPTSGITYIDLYYNDDDDTLYCKDPKLTFVRLP